MDDFEHETVMLAEAVEQHAAKATHGEVKRILEGAAKSIKEAASKHHSLHQ